MTSPNLQPTILTETDHWLAVDKPAGLVVHAATTHTGDTLVDWLIKRERTARSLPHAGLVHRLDKDTSGVLLVAKTPEMFAYFKSLFKGRKISKEYLALVVGRLSPRRGIIRIPITRDPIRRTQFGPAYSGKLSETKNEVISYYPAATYLRVWPTTGRTHQIRVHLAGLGHPIVGDTVYGTPHTRSHVQPTGRHFLHAHQLTFTTPDGQSRTVIAPLPPDLKRQLDALN